MYSSVNVREDAGILYGKSSFKTSFQTEPEGHA
jgi:hypothetical protein